MNQLYVKLLTAIIIVILTVISGMTSDINYSLLIMAILASTPFIPDLIKEYEDNLRTKKKVNKYIDVTKYFLIDTKIPFQIKSNKINKIISNYINLNEEDPFEIKKLIFKSIFPELIEDQLEYLTIYSLCYDFIKNRNLSYKQIIRNYINSRNYFNSKSSNSKLFLSGYYNAFRSKKEIEFMKISQLFELQKEDQFKLAINHIINYYFETKYLNYFEDRLQKQEDLRRTLVELVTKGKLSIRGVISKTENAIMKELAEKGQTNKPLLIVKAEGGDKEKVITKSLKELKVPRIVGPATASAIPNHRGKYALFIINAKNHPTFLDFIRTNIESKLENSTDYEGLIKIYKLEPSTSFMKIFSKNGQLTKDTLKKCENTLSYFDSKYSTVAIEDIIDRLEIESGEMLLSILPFNLLVPNISEAERLFLIKNYEQVKKVFNVEKLTEWQKILPQELFNYLASLKHPQYTQEECIIKFNKKIDQVTNEEVLDRLKDITESIITKSKEYSDSLIVNFA